MAGGPSTPELAIAVSEAGGLGFLAAGYERADAVRAEIEAIRESTNAPFGVNLFVPAPERADTKNLQDYLRRLKPEADRQGAELGEAKFDDDDYPAKLELMYEQRPAVTSFT
ncbi:MAG: nitronate monooxygenase, partial [Solirubrobacteraceae bacterium]